MQLFSSCFSYPSDWYTHHTCTPTQIIIATLASNEEEDVHFHYPCHRTLVFLIA